MMMVSSSPINLKSSDANDINTTSLALKPEKLLLFNQISLTTFLQSKKMSLKCCKPLLL